MLSITLENREQSITLSQVVVDTGSVSTIFATEKVALIGLQVEPNDEIFIVRGVGGIESVVSKTISAITVEADVRIENFRVEVGAMDYGFDLDGIVGLDFLECVGAVLDIANVEIIFHVQE